MYFFMITTELYTNLQSVSGQGKISVLIKKLIHILEYGFIIVLSLNLSSTSKSSK